MHPKLLFYISGHGYGHAIRSTELIRALNLPVFVRTIAPEHLFQGLPVRYSAADFDSGVVETDGSLGIDIPATVASVQRIHDQRNTIIQEETAFIRANRIEKIVADVPYLAGDIASAAGLPCIGIGNFTWDWIYDPYLGGRTPSSAIRDGYSKMTRFCRLPFHHAEGFDIFQHLDDVPLIARKPKKIRDEVFSETGRRPLILVGMRGPLSPGALQIAAKESPGMLFLHFDPDESTEAPNVKYVQLGTAITFPDVLAASDIVVSKFGYGIVSECTANRKPMLVPPRSDFREDEIFRREAPRHIPIAEIARLDFQAGNWKHQLESLLNTKCPDARLPTNGAEVCAELIMNT